MKLLKSLSGLVDSLEDLPDSVPEGSTLVYAEVETEEDGQTILATFEDGEWSVSLEGGSSADANGDGDEEEDEEEDETAEYDDDSEDEDEDEDEEDEEEEEAPAPKRRVRASNR